MEKLLVPPSLQNLSCKSTTEHYARKSFPIVTVSPCAQAKKKSIKLGVVLSGGPAPGGHNVIWGILDALHECSEKVTVIGFLNGASGILRDEYMLLNQEVLKPFHNSGGFHLLGTGRTKIETPEQLLRVMDVCSLHQLDGLVIIGGDDSNTNAWHLAEYFRAEKSATTVVGVPKTIDGDLQFHPWLEVSFGFHTATQIYSYLVSNLIQDTASGKKYYHFVRLMGRSASHITLEVALQTHPTIALISEYILSQNLTLQEVVVKIADVVSERAAAGKNFGVVLVPEGLLEFFADFKLLISDLDKIYARSPDLVNLKFHQHSLTELPHGSLGVFANLPLAIQLQLCAERDSHGNIQLSKIETEKFLAELVKAELQKRSIRNIYTGKFATLCHFFGYEARSAPPSDFDATYAYALGRNAALLVRDERSGYLSCMQNLTESPESWLPIGLPIECLLQDEVRHGKTKKVIRKALVEPCSQGHAAWSQLDSVLGQKTLGLSRLERDVATFSRGVCYANRSSNRPLLLPNSLPSTIHQLVEDF